MTKRIVGKVKVVTIAVVLAAAFVGGVVGYFACQVQHAPPETSSTTALSLLEQINKVRSDNGVTPLAADPTLTNTAKIKALDMADLNYFSHSRPNGERFEVNIFVNRPGSNKVGENLAKLAGNEAVFAWKQSPVHLATLLDPAFTKFGEYTTWDLDQGMYISVTHFGD